LNLPNSLSALRILLTPVFVLLYETGRTRAAIAVLLLAALSDLLDGMLARTLGQVTELGKALDPVADKLLQLAMLLCALRRFPVLRPVLLLHVLREGTTGALELLAYRRLGAVEGARWYGKACTAILYTVLTALLIVPQLPERLVRAGAGLCAGCILACLLLYTARLLRALRAGRA